MRKKSFKISLKLGNGNELQIKIGKETTGLCDLLSRLVDLTTQDKSDKNQNFKSNES